MDQRLSTISTKWSVLQCAHGGNAAAAADARRQLLERYGGAVRRYLRRGARNAAEADDLYQEFALALVRGDFHRADPRRGRFRDYVKVVLFHLVSHHRRGEQRLPQPLPPDSAELTALASPEAAEAGREFDQSWRADLLARVWAGLAAAHPMFHSVLRFRAEHPDTPSAQIAEALARLGRAVTAGGIRQTLRRARELFAQLLLDEVAQSMDDPNAEQLEQELDALDLLAYCRPALEKRAAGM